MALSIRERCCDCAVFAAWEWHQAMRAIHGAQNPSAFWCPLPNLPPPPPSATRPRPGRPWRVADPDAPCACILPLRHARTATAAPSAIHVRVIEPRFRISNSRRRAICLGLLANAGWCRGRLTAVTHSEFVRTLCVVNGERECALVFASGRGRNCNPGQCRHSPQVGLRGLDLGSRSASAVVPAAPAAAAIFPLMYMRPRAR